MCKPAYGWLTVGAFALIVAVILLGYLFSPGPAWQLAGETARCSACKQNLNAIYMVVGEQAEERAVADIMGVLKASSLLCPSRAVGEPSPSYSFVADSKLWVGLSSPPLPLAWDNRPRHRGSRNMVFQGGSVRELSEKEVNVQLQRLGDLGIRVWPVVPESTTGARER